ncbi:MAG: transposase [Roseiarcus sp.]
MPALARRVEIFTRAGRRRSWTEQEKAAIVAESFEDGARACHVARRHGLTPQQLFTWRREARRKAGEETGAPPLVPAIVEAASGAATPTPRVKGDTAARPPIIELDVALSMPEGLCGGRGGKCFSRTSSSLTA